MSKNQVETLNIDEYKFIERDMLGYFSWNELASYSEWNYGHKNYQSNFQEYWRTHRLTGKIRNLKELKNEIRSTNDGIKYHILHFPCFNPDGTDTGKIFEDLYIKFSSIVNDTIFSDKFSTIELRGIISPKFQIETENLNKEIYITDSLFYQYMDFFEITFEEKSHFYNTNFYRGVHFEGARFKKHASFEYTNFEYANFSLAKFESTVDFIGATFNSMNFESTEFFGSVNFINIKWPKSPFEFASAFTNTVFKGLADFTGSGVQSFSAFDGAIFESGIKLDYLPEVQVLQKFNHELKQILKIENKADQERLLKSLEAGCRILKHEMSKISDKSREQFFYRLELKSKKHRLNIFSLERLSSSLYEITSDYGLSISRPSASILMIFIIFTTLYVPFTSKLYFNPTCLKEHSCDFVNNDDLITSTSISLNRMLPFGAYEGLSSKFASKIEIEQPSLAWLFRFIASMQSLCTLICSFLLALSIRRKFQIT